MRLLAIVAAALVVGSRPVPADQGATPHPSGHGSVTTSPDEPAGRPLNRAASLDGVDTSLRIGMGVMPPPWTLEACGHLPFHVRSGRIDHKGSAPLAEAVVNDKPRFADAAATQRLFNAVVIHGDWDADAGATDDPVLKLRVAVQGQAKPMRITALDLDLAACTSLADLRRVNVYSTGQKARARNRERLSAAGLAPARSLSPSARLRGRPVLPTWSRYRRLGGGGSAAVGRGGGGHYRHRCRTGRRKSRRPCAAGDHRRRLQLRQRPGLDGGRRPLARRLRPCATAHLAADARAGLWRCLSRPPPRRSGPARGHVCRDRRAPAALAHRLHRSSGAGHPAGGGEDRADAPRSGF